MPQIIDVPGHGQVEFPDGMSDQDITSAIQKNLSPPKASMGDIIAGTPVARLTMGAASPLIGAAQVGAHVGDIANRAMGVAPVVSPWIDKQLADYEAAKQRGMKASGTEGFDWMGLAGSVLPSSSMATGIQAILPTAKTVLGRAGLGALQGGVAAGVQPITNTVEGFWTPKGTQTAAGTAIGGAIPLVGNAVKGVGSLVTQLSQPFTEKGRAAILKEFQEGLMGNNPSTKQQIINALANAKQIVSGSRPTVGEAVAHIPESTGLAAHQKDISKLPIVSPQFAQRAAEQEGARAGAISQVAKTPSALEQAMQSRSIAAKQNYGTAFRDTVNPDASFAALMDRPSMQKAVSRASELAKEEGTTFDPSSVKSLHYVKMAMDDLLKNPERFSIGATEAGSIGKTQQEFVKWLGQQSPAYAIARTTHQALSEPVNRMQVGQELEKALTTPLGTSERSGMFAKAIEDAPRTIKRATGQQMFDTLDEVLQPQETASVRKIADELARKDAFERLARGTSLSGKDAIPGQVGLPLPNLLSRPAMIANFMLRHAGKGAEEKIGKLAANQYLNPQVLADSLRDIPPRYRPMIEALMRQAPAAAGTGIGRTLGGEQ